MSLRSLFLDREARIKIQGSINEATDLEGVCECCSRHSNILDTPYGKLCGDCCDKVIEEVVENYDLVLENDDISTVRSFLNIDEGMAIVGNMTKFENDYTSKFHNSMEEVYKEYGLNIAKDWTGNWANSKLWITPANITGGKTKLNRFIDDYDIEFTKQKSLDMLVPDADGYSASHRVIGGKPVIASKTATIPAISKTPAKTTTKSVVTKTGSKIDKGTTSKGLKVEADSRFDTIVIHLASDLDMTCTKDASKSTNDLDEYSVSLSNGASVPTEYFVDNKLDTAEKRGESLVKSLLSSINTVFKAFYNNPLRDDKFYQVPKYDSIFEFEFDEESFTGKKISLGMWSNGKKGKNRPELDAKDLDSKIMLDKKLTYYIDAQLKNFYPALFSKALQPRLSIGDVVTDYDYVEANGQKGGLVHLKSSILNQEISWTISGSDLTDDATSRNVLLEEVYKNFKTLIPGWDIYRIAKPVSSKFSDSFEITIDMCGNSGCVVAMNFSDQDFYDSGKVIFKCSVIDKHSGVEQPKEYQNIVYSDFKNLKVIANQFALDVYKRFFKDSDMNGSSMTASAIEKMGNKSKKFAFMDKIAGRIGECLFNKRNFKVYTGGKDRLDSITVDVDVFDVNTDTGKLNRVRFTIEDEDEVFVGTDNFSTFKDYVTTLMPSEIYGAIVKNMTTDSRIVVDIKGKGIQAFSDWIQLNVIESEMFRAFGVHINESGRKTIEI